MGRRALPERLSEAVLSDAAGTGVWAAVFPEGHNRLLTEGEPRWRSDLKVPQWSVIVCNCLSRRAGKNVSS